MRKRYDFSKGKRGKYTRKVKEKKEEKTVEEGLPKICQNCRYRGTQKRGWCAVISAFVKRKQKACDDFKEKK